MVDMSWPLSLPVQLRKCLKPDCMRKVKLGITYCCGECAVAAKGRYEIHDHSDGCNTRTTERGECDEYEALLLQQ
jgi:hypothetical protein